MLEFQYTVKTGPGILYSFMSWSTYQVLGMYRNWKWHKLIFFRMVIVDVKSNGGGGGGGGGEEEVSIETVRVACR